MERTKQAFKRNVSVMISYDGHSYLRHGSSTPLPGQSSVEPPRTSSIRSPPGASLRQVPVPGKGTGGGERPATRYPRILPGECLILRTGREMSICPAKGGYAGLYMFIVALKFTNLIQLVQPVDTNITTAKGENQLRVNKYI